MSKSEGHDLLCAAIETAFASPEMYRQNIWRHVNQHDAHVHYRYSSSALITYVIWSVDELRACICRQKIETNSVRDVCHCFANKIIWVKVTLLFNQLYGVSVATGRLAPQDWLKIGCDRCADNCMFSCIKCYVKYIKLQRPKLSSATCLVLRLNDDLIAGIMYRTWICNSTHRKLSSLLPFIHVDRNSLLWKLSGLAKVCLSRSSVVVISYTSHRHRKELKMRLGWTLLSLHSLSSSASVP